MLARVLRQACVGDEFLAIVTGISSDALDTSVESLKRAVAQQPVMVAGIVG